ncbi:MAG: winged helix-turn-helix domain-containing protein [Candidatus Aramenus sulfurataquae]|jgi:predicted transcriptional regulator|uniref:Winged helix-turn-helix domain-containing protein n=2 Tax=Candidatus Aramenus sulfurataquae TaxID=1326980 RepID=A0AAE3K360_9CREN|nr:winged helix-turn-helix domain-containing protein [Candidatus Aramenus sulfurataquae]
MKYRRDQLDITVDVLEVIDGGMGSKSGIMKNANLSSVLAEKYTSILAEKGLITYKDGRYEITEKGKQVLERLRRIRRLQLEIDELINSVSKELF